MPRKEIIMATFSKSKLRKIFEDAELEVSRDVLEKICDLHTDTLDGLNDTVKELKTSLETAENERDTYKAKAPKEGEETVLKSEYDKLKKEYDDYKADNDGKELLRKKQSAYRELAKGVEGLSDTGIEKAVKYADYSKIDLDKDGKIVDADKHTEFIESEWGGYKTQTTTQFNRTENPPANGGGKSSKTREEIMAMTDGVKRREAMYSNSHLFPELGIKKD